MSYKLHLVAAATVCICTVPTPALAMGPLNSTASVGATDGQGELRQQIESAWANRQKRVDSLSLKWTETRFLKKGSLRIPGEMDNPPADESAVVDGIALTIQGDNARYETELLTSGFPHIDGVRTKYASAYDGVVATSLYHPHGQSVGNAHQERRHSFGECKEGSLLPALLAFRPLSKAFLALSLDDFDVDADNNLLTLRQKPEVRKDPRLQHVIVVDASQDFLPMSFAELFEEQPTLQVTIEYAGDASDQKLSAWHIEYLDSQLVPIRTRDAIVQSCEINGPVDKGGFRLDFPAGTHIADRNTGEEFIVNVDGVKTALSNWGEPDGTQDITKGGWTTAHLTVVLLVVTVIALCAIRFAQQR